MSSERMGESIGGQATMTYPHIRPELRAPIKSVVVKEYEGLTMRSLNDDCVEGLRPKGRPVFSVQYHPESSPGPHDSDDWFGAFVGLLMGSLDNSESS